MRALHMPKQYYCIEFEEKQKHKAAYIRRLSEYKTTATPNERDRAHTLIKTSEPLIIIIMIKFFLENSLNWLRIDSVFGMFGCAF